MFFDSINLPKPYIMSNIKFVQSCWNFPQLGGVHKLRLQYLVFFDHLPPSSCKRSLWTPPKTLVPFRPDKF